MKYIPYMKTYDTRRLWVEETDKGFEVILNETIFQPRSEFYPSDRGIISGIAVEEVFVRNGKIIHLLLEKPWEEVMHLELDVFRHFDILQQQTGFSLFKIALERLYDTKIISYKINDKDSEIVLPIFSREQEKRAEIFTNRLITSAMEIEALRENDFDVSENFNYSDEGTMFVSIYETPFNGLQCKNTGEVGMFKIVDRALGNDSLSLKFLCGERAFKYFQEMC